MNLKRPIEPAENKPFLSFLAPKEASVLTVQQTLPYHHIYRDGLCALPNKRYSKTVQFEDINYQLATQSDKDKIFDRWCKVLQGFKEDVDIQLTFVNKFIGKQDLKKAISLPPVKDGYQVMRRELRELLQTQMTKGNNGLAKSKYLTFTIVAKNLTEARTRMASIERDVAASFKELAVRMSTLNGMERIQMLHSQTHPYGDEKIAMTYSDLHKQGISSKDLIAPEGLEFSDSKYFRLGESHASVNYLKINAAKLPDFLLSDFLAMETAQTVTIHLRKVAQEKAEKLARRKLSAVNADKAKEQKKASKEGYGWDVVNPDIERNAQESSAMLADIESHAESFFLMNVTIMNVDRRKKALESKLNTLKTIASKAGCTLRPLLFQQEQGFVSSLGLGVNQIAIERGINTTGLGSFVPFTTSELFQGGQSIYYGLNALSDNMIMANRKSLPNPNGLVLGMPGMGKSFMSKLEMFIAFLTTKDDILIVDPEGEYAPVVEMMGGQVVNVSQNSPHFINPMDIHKDYAADSKGEDPIALKSNYLLSLFELILRSPDGIPPAEVSIIDRCLRQIYEPYLRIENPTPEQMPILEDLYNLLLIEAEKGNEAADFVASALEMYVHGSLNMFNRRTNIDLSNRVVCFDIRSLQTQLKKIGMLVIQDSIWGRVSQNRDNLVSDNKATAGKKVRKYTWLYIDEFHLLLKEKQTAQYCTEIYKRFRKWAGIPTGLTQNVSDLLSSPEASAIFKNSPFILMLGQAEEDRRILAKSLSISEQQLSFVTESGPGEGLLFFWHTVIPFKNEFPRDTVMYKAMTTKPDDN